MCPYNRDSNTIYNRFPSRGDGCDSQGTSSSSFSFSAFHSFSPSYSAADHSTPLNTLSSINSPMANTNRVLAGPIGDCCVQGVKHTGTAVGRTVEIGGVATYISEPSQTSSDVGRKRVIFYFADIYGPFYLNAQLLMDYYASQGTCSLKMNLFRI